MFVIPSRLNLNCSLTMMVSKNKKLVDTDFISVYFENIPGSNTN